LEGNSGGGKLDEKAGLIGFKGGGGGGGGFFVWGVEKGVGIIFNFGIGGEEEDRAQCPKTTGMLQQRGDMFHKDLRGGEKNLRKAQLHS